MPFVWPLPDSVTTRNFYFKSSFYVDGQHAATDRVKRVGVTLGAELVAPGDSLIIGDAWDPYSGYFVAGRTSDGWIWFVRHLITDSPLVRGQIVVKGQAIGRVGSTGASTGPHAHCDWWNEERRSPEAFYKNGWWAHDPELYLGKEDDEVKYRLIRGTTATVYLTDGFHKKGIPNPTVLADLRKLLDNDAIEIVSDATINWMVPF